MARRNYKIEIESQKRSLVRPESCEKLLWEPITDTSPSAGERSYSGWELDHASKSRFYVGGFREFLQLGAVADAQDLYGRFWARTLEVAQTTGWTSEVPLNNEAWTKLSYNQFRFARLGQALQFPKAALVILACELAVDQAIKDNRTLRMKVSAGADIYKFMSIIPACWNLDDFNQAYLEGRQKLEPRVFERLRDGAGQTSKKVIEDLANGHTVTRDTAMGVKERLVELSAEDAAGDARAHPGNNLGTKSASENESFDKG